MKKGLLFLWCLTGLLFLMPFSACSANQAKSEKVTLQLNWYNSAEFAGFYMAEAKGFFGQSSLEVAITLLTFTLLYGGLAVVEVGLLLRRIRAGLPPEPGLAGADGDEAERPAAFAY